MTTLKKTALALAAFASLFAMSAANAANTSSPYYVGVVKSPTKATTTVKSTTLTLTKSGGAQVSTMTAGGGDCSEESNENCGGSNTWDFFYDSSTSTELYIERGPDGDPLPNPGVWVRYDNTQWLDELYEFLNNQAASLYAADKDGFHFVYDSIQGSTYTVPTSVNMCSTSGNAKGTTSFADSFALRSAIGQAVAGVTIGNYSGGSAPYSSIAVNDQRDIGSQASRNGGVTVTLADGGVVVWSVDPEGVYGGYISSIQSYGSGVSACPN